MLDRAAALNAIQKRSAWMAKFSAWFRSFSPFSDVYGASKSVTWREGVAEANCSAVRDGRDTCESAVDRPISNRRQP